jgi:alpha-tubulin suppressor-like RCC1 family protein
MGSDVAQAGDSTTDVSSDATDAALPPLAITPTLALGFGFSCVSQANGSVWCWGLNSTGEFGNMATNTTNPNPVPGQVDNIMNAATIGAGAGFVCALATDHTVWCWGQNTLGQVGQAASTTPTLVPTQVPGLTDVVQLAVGGNHVCARKNDSSVWCWGDNAFDQLGYSNATDTLCGGTLCNPTPTKVAGLVAANIASGVVHTCAQVGTTAQCWGANGDAQLGHLPGQMGDLGTSPNYYNPTPNPAAATGVDAIYAGGDVTCSISGSQALSCWGSDNTGQLGDEGAAGAQTINPVIVTGVNPTTQAAPGFVNSCAVANSAVFCWGDNVGCEEGTNQDGGTDIGPSNVSGLNTGVVQVASDMIGAHHCALKDTGDVLCWGENDHDELGHDNSTDRTCPGGAKGDSTPTLVAGL